MAEGNELKRTLENFYACDRCSFFIAGYRVLHGLESVDRPSEEGDGSWLVLTWDRPTRLLLEKSYGSQLDIELFYFDGQCPGCQRRFVYDGGIEGGAEGTFRIEIRTQLTAD